ncbi:hypothetical protein B0H11DRAFT_2018661 [Mycena galericulata]|nr:hypothetical protein B0H11DRAFT_2018661 [Mycena galericulata]
MLIFATHIEWLCNGANLMSEFSSLCPGYRHVEAFGPDEEYEEEEVTYVTLDLGDVEPTLIPSSSNYRLIGLDTPTPFLQLSGTIFKGRHNSLLGTELLFTDGKDPSDWSKRAITHVANTEQRICFKEVQLKPKKAIVPDPPLNEESIRLKVDQITGNATRPVVPRGRKLKTVAPAEEEEVGEDEEVRSVGAVDKQM